MDIRPIRTIREFYATVATPCPYLSGRQEQKLVVELKGPEIEHFYADLSRAGFRRSHDLAYRPACRACSACVPVRIDVDRFTATRSLRRVARRNADLIVDECAPRASAEQYALFSRYLASRHSESDMTEMAYRDYRTMVEATPIETTLVQLHAPDGRLVLGCVTDRMPDALSAVYSFFDPAEAERSLGTQAILTLIDIAREEGLAHVYLGYWIAESRSMTYKRRFPALEGFIDGRWQPLPRVTA